MGIFKQDKVFKKNNGPKTNCYRDKIKRLFFTFLSQNATFKIIWDILQLVPHFYTHETVLFVSTQEIAFSIPFCIFISCLFHFKEYPKWQRTLTPIYLKNEVKHFFILFLFRCSRRGAVFERES